MNFLKTNAGHFIGAALFVLAAFGFHLWLQEHDARMAAENTVKTAQAQIDSLKTQEATVAQTARVQIVTLQKDAAAVKTTPEAIKELSSVETTPLNAEALPLPGQPPLPDAPGKVAVDAVPLYQDLNACKQDAVNLAACTSEQSLQTKIDADKDAEIAALKKGPGFWHAVKVTAVTAGIGALVGYVAAKQ
jgi:hypothetical protein